MIKVDLLKDSLNYNASKSDEKPFSGDSVEDLSDLNFDNSADLDIDLSEDKTDEESFSFDEDIPSAPEPKVEKSEDSLLADLGLDDDDQYQAESLSEDIPEEETEEIIQEEFVEEKAEVITKEQPVAMQQENSPQFDFSSTDDEFDSYEEDSFEAGSNKSKYILIALFVIVVLAGGSYFLFFSGDPLISSDSVVEEQTVAPEQNALEVERQRKINDLSNYWKNLSISNMVLTNPIQKLSSITTPNTSLSIVRYRDEKLVLTVVSNNRDDLVDLNNNLKKNLNIKNMEYINVSPMKIDNEIKMVSDINIELFPVTSAGINVEAQTHLNQSADQVKSFFSQKGISKIKFNQKSSSKSGANVSIKSCTLTGNGKYSQISGALNKLTDEYPQIKINKVFIFSKNQASISKSTLTFEMTFDFHQSAL